jgi:hypothetical protein
MGRGYLFQGPTKVLIKWIKRGIKRYLFLKSGTNHHFSDRGNVAGFQVRAISQPSGKSPGGFFSWKIIRWQL